MDETSVLMLVGVYITRTFGRRKVRAFRKVVKVPGSDRERDQYDVIKIKLVN